MKQTKLFKKIIPVDAENQKKQIHKNGGLLTIKAGGLVLVLKFTPSVITSSAWGA